MQSSGFEITSPHNEKDRTKAAGVAVPQIWLSRLIFWAAKNLLPQPHPSHSRGTTLLPFRLTSPLLKKGTKFLKHNFQTSYPGVRHSFMWCHIQCLVTQPIYCTSLTASAPTDARRPKRNSPARWDLRPAGILLLLLLFTAIEFSLGGSSSHTSNK